MQFVSLPFSSLTDRTYLEEMLPLVRLGNNIFTRHCRGEAINFTEIQMKRNHDLDGINHSEPKVRAHQKLLNQSNTVFGLTDIRTSMTVPVSIRLGWIPGLRRSHAVQVMIQVSRGTSLSEDR